MSISNASLDNITSEALDLIVDRFRCTEDDKCGWHQHLDNLDKVGNAATAQALMVLSKFRHIYSNSKNLLNIVEEAVKTLINSQNTDGGWSYETNVVDISTTEPTSWCVLGLIDSLYFDFPTNFKNKIENCIIRGIDWLCKNSDNGKWAPLQGMNPRVYSTSIALRALVNFIKQKINSNKINWKNIKVLMNKGRKWLKQIQNDDGGWGEKEQSYSTYLHTAHAAITLIDLGEGANNWCIKRALDFLINGVENNFGWMSPTLNSGMIEIIDFPSRKRIIYFHFVDAWVLNLFLKINIDIFSMKNITRVFNKLINTGYKNKGIWYHPYLPNTKTMWAQHDILLLLYLFITKSKENIKLISIEDAKPYNIDKILGNLENRIFVGGNYDNMVLLREICKIVSSLGFQPILAWDFDVPLYEIHDYDLRLLHNCKYAIFEVSAPAGELMEIEKIRDWNITTLLLYQVRDPHNPSPPSSLTSMLKTFKYNKLTMEWYSDIDELKEKILNWINRMIYDVL